MNVSFSSPNWGLEGEEFNATLVFENVTEATSISLTPNWDRLNISENDLIVDKDVEIVLDMKASHFYLFKVNMSCSNTQLQENALFEVRSKKCMTLTFANTSCIVFPDAGSRRQNTNRESDCPDIPARHVRVPGIRDVAHGLRAQV